MTTDQPASSDRGPEETPEMPVAPPDTINSAEDDQGLAEAVARRRRERIAEQDALAERMRLGREFRELEHSASFRAARERVQRDPAEVDAEIAAIDRETLAEMERTRRDRRFLAYAATRRPDYDKASLADLDPQQDPDGRVSRWWEHSDARTLLLAGPSGHGKTHAAYAITNTVADADQRGEQDATVRAFSAVDLADALRPLAEHERRDPEASARQARTYDDARSCDLLLLDDLGREQVTDWWRERLFSILDARATDRTVRTIITLNAVARKDVAELFAVRYGSPVQSRIQQDAVAAWIEGQAKRQLSAWDPFA